MCALVRAKSHRLPPAAYVWEKAVNFTACLESRKHGFVDHATVEPLIKLLVGSAQRMVCVLPIYCFMPDHLHVVISGTSPQSRPKAAMDDFKNQSAIWMASNLPGIVWQDDYFDHIIRRNVNFESQVMYIAENPVRAGLVQAPSEYRFTGSLGSELRHVAGWR